MCQALGGRGSGVSLGTLLQQAAVSVDAPPELDGDDALNLGARPRRTPPPLAPRRAPPRRA